MVIACCVRSCRNSFVVNTRKKQPGISFHSFPSNKILEKRWLKAIGRENWKPPACTSVCSLHFTDDQFNDQIKNRRVLKKGACPVKELPVLQTEPKQQNKNDVSDSSDTEIDKTELDYTTCTSWQSESASEASPVEVCRVCLASDVKMYSLQDQRLGNLFKCVVWSSNEINLPQFVCYECSAQLIRCYSFIQKTNTAKDVLSRILSEHGSITKKLVKKVNRTRLKLKSPLTYNETETQTFIFYGTPKQVKFENNINAEDNIDYFKDTANIIQVSNIDYKMNTGSESDDDMVIVGDDVKDNSFNTVSDDGSGADDDQDDDDDIPLAAAKLQTNNKIESTKTSPSKDLTSDDIKLQEYFDILFSSMRKVIAQRQRMKETEKYKMAAHKCELCFKTFDNEDVLSEHMKHHDPEIGEAECPVCKYRFKNESLAKSHVLRLHRKTYRCKSCYKVYGSIRVARQHQRRHEGILYKCSLCFFTTKSYSSLTKHNREKHAVHGCPHCDKRFSNELGLVRHTRFVHKDKLAGVGSTFYCASCDTRFPSEAEWRLHECTARDNDNENNADLLNEESTTGDVNKKPLFKCIHCDLQFRDQHLLRNHRSFMHYRKRTTDNQTDPGDAQINSLDRITMYCSQCQTQFLSEDKWRQHGCACAKVTMSRRKKVPPEYSYPMICEHCGENMKSRSEHYTHFRKVHPTVPYLPYMPHVCHTCGKRYRVAVQLHQHELRHRGVPTIPCTKCPKMLYDYKQLKSHMIVHSDERSYACKQCGKTYKHRRNRDRHMMVHTDEMPYKCPACDKFFRYSTARNDHLRTVHYKMPYRKHKNRKETSAEEVTFPNIEHNVLLPSEEHILQDNLPITQE